MSRTPSRVAYAEDAEEYSGSDYEVIAGTKKYARSEAPTELSRERSNTSKSRIERQPYNRSPSSRITDSDDESDDSDQPNRIIRRQSQANDRDFRELERRKPSQRHQEELRTKPTKLPPQPLHQTRPSPLKHSATVPVVQHDAYRRGQFEDPSYYGLQQPAVTGTRPRARTRPASYYAGQAARPSLPSGGMSWMHGHPPPAPMNFPVGTFPPPQHMYPAASPTAMSGYFDTSMNAHDPRYLKQRFDMRPSSALGFQSQAIPVGFPPGRDTRGMQPPPISMARRPSASRQKKDIDDRRKMPPPDFIPKRPQSAALPPSTPFRPPQRPPSRQQPSRTSHRRSVGFANKRGGYEDEDFGGDDGLFHDISPEPSREQRRQNIARTRRALVQYRVESEEEDDEYGDVDDAYDLVHTDARGRRGSLYASRALGTGGVSLSDEKYLDAVRYQTELGGAKVPLTEESLQRVTRPRGVPSSRSTRSSGSRDDSDYKRSNTTGLTKSSTMSDGVTIKLSGAALVTMGDGAEMDVAGGEIRFRSRPTGSRSGSDRASTVYQVEEPRDRYERKALPQRSRPPSQSDSQGRRYLAHAPYEPAFADNYF